MVTEFWSEINANKFVFCFKIKIFEIATKFEFRRATPKIVLFARLIISDMY